MTMEIGLVIAGAVIFLFGLLLGAGIVIYCVKQYLKMNGYIIQGMQLIKPLTKKEMDMFFTLSPLDIEKRFKKSND